MSFLFLILMLQCSVVTGQFYSFTVRRGDDVTLPCVNVGDDQEKCGKTDWIFVDSENRAQVSLFEFGKITTESNSKSDRLSVTENCSLVIKKVTVEDVGRYTCRQQGGDSLVDLSVVTMTQDEADNKVTLSCSVSTYRQCRHTVKWQHQRNDYFTDVKTSQSSCSAIVTTSHLTERYDDLLKCAVTDGRGRTSTFSPQFSGDDAMTAKSTTIKSPLSAGTTLTTDPIEQQDLLRSIIVPVGLAALIISVVSVNMWTRTKGKKTQMKENTVGNDEDEV
ncbi:hypothetical protein EXN66_Car018835 [Channa argus]|uniref:Ig-like domain-containing protein n=1 Tax=Channa argus TaxID=215402 RepID=A0A6G1QL05_CHAAH|nr:hypothetical protein EXN66_Car018835 [Channa argus]